MRFERTIRPRVAALASVAFVGALADVAPAYRVTEVESGGTIAGVVRFAHEPPAPRYLKVDHDKKSCGTEHLSEEIVVDPETRGLKNAVAVLVDMQEGKAYPADLTLELDQVGCRYEPHVQVGFLTGGAEPAGASLLILNSDDVFHNVHAVDRKDETIFNTPSIPARDVAKSLTEAGIYRMKCDIHSWMSAWVVVTDHPYAAVTDEKGRFRLEDVPPGEFRLEIWHETLGTLEQDVVVLEGKETSVAFVLGLDE